MKDVYPRLAGLILKIPNKIGKPLTWLLTLFMLFNAAMSAVAVERWVERTRSIAPATALGSYMDEHYPDERMQRIYANMEFK